MQNFKFRFGLEDNVYFYNYNVEVDFVVPDKSMAIQVCYDLGNDTSETYLRETKALLILQKDCNTLICTSLHTTKSEK